jgi:glycosyltransferase involved in cell wall biosynthesis
MRREIKERGVDLVHAQGFSALAAAGPAARITGRPCLLHLRDLRYGRRVARQLCRFADRTIAISRAVAEAAPVDCTVVPNGIDADAFAAAARPGAFRAELGAGPEVPLVLVASQLVPWKGHEFFLRAFARLRARRPDAVACLAGQDMFAEHPGHLERLQALAGALGLGEAVHWLGWRDDMPALMADADVLAVPSEAEPFGRVALEAMAVGTPVVGRRLGGLPEVVQHGATGYLCRPDSTADFAECILRALEAGEHMQQAARRRVREEFSIQRHAERVCAVYGEILAAC